MRYGARNAKVHQEAVSMFELVKRLWHDEEGLSTVEYALLLVLIVIVGITAWQTLGSSVSTRVNEVNNTVTAAGS
jgi:Flp pilus assembly pilin Flp